MTRSRKSALKQLLTTKDASRYVSAVGTKKKPKEPKPESKPADLNLIERPMTPRDLAAFLQVSPITIRRLLRDGKLPHFRLGQRVRFMPSAVLDALKTSTTTPAAPTPPVDKAEKK